MSSILRTINALKEIHVGDYVEFHKDRLGYVEEIISPDTLSIIEDDGTLRSSRNRRFNVRMNKVALIPKAGNGYISHRSLIQPPEPYESSNHNDTDDFSDDTKELIQVLKDTHIWTCNANRTDHPFMTYLIQNNSKESGWIIKNLPNKNSDSDTGKDLDSTQRMIFITTYNLFSGFPKTHGPLKGWQNYFYKAWGVSKWTANRIIGAYYDNGFVPNRKTRKDKGMTLINSEQKRKSTYTPLYIYKREQTHKRYRSHTIRLNAVELKNEFESLDELEKKTYDNIANNFIQQGYSIHHNIIRALQKICGNMTYKAIANYLGGTVTENTVAKHLKSLNGFSVAKARILPQLTRQAMQKRLDFCESFFIFWKSAKCLKPDVKIIVTHMDEKWVHAVVARTNIKLIENYDVGKRYHYAHHKNYIDQVMFIVVNGFVPKDNNLLGNGGRSIKVSCVPVGDYEQAKRDSYKRVYDDEGRFTYPKIPENLERRKGQYYWKNKTLCGSNEPGDDQFSLIRAYREFIIPEMEKIQLKESEGGRFRVVFMEQEDGAGCHTSAEYQKFKEDEFTNRNWLRLRQSPQSPLFNVNDLFYFRKISTEISAEQSMCFGTRVMKCDEILKVVDKVWKSTDDAVAISRGWMSHYQVIAAAYEMKGYNAYLKQNNGLDFGIRYNFYPNRERTGVVKVVEFENVTTPAEQIANERIRKGLKYKIPPIT